MDYTTLGRTRLGVSRMGPGSGGHSRLGLARGGSVDNAERIVKDALSLGHIGTTEAFLPDPSHQMRAAAVEKDGVSGN